MLAGVVVHPDEQPAPGALLLGVIRKATDRAGRLPP
jgi:hypothetical protein